MLNIVIDGYNLIGIAHKDLEKARDSLIQKLDRDAHLKGHNVILVFDGWRGGRSTETREKRGNITVIYSSIGEKADDFIKKMLASSREKWVVVSSDREIYGFAERKGLVALTRDEFDARIDSVLAAFHGQEELLECEEEDDDLGPAWGKKGNPRKLSKKNKRKMDALKKL